MNREHRNVLEELARVVHTDAAGAPERAASFTVPISMWAVALPFVRGLETMYGVSILGHDAGDVAGQPRVRPVVRRQAASVTDRRQVAAGADASARADVAGGCDA